MNETENIYEVKAELLQQIKDKDDVIKKLQNVIQFHESGLAVLSQKQIKKIKDDLKKSEIENATLQFMLNKADEQTQKSVSQCTINKLCHQRI